MGVRLLPFAALLLSLLAPSRPAEASSGAGVGGFSFGPEPVTRRQFASGGALVVSPSEDAATVTICAGNVTGPPPTTDERVALERRGGAAALERAGALSVFCVRVPPQELAFATQLAAARLPRPDLAGPGARERRAAPGAPGGPASDVSLERVQRLALEGMTTSDAPLRRGVIAVAGRVRADDVQRVVERYVSPTTAPAEISPLQWTLHQSSERLSVLEADGPAPSVRYAWAFPNGSPGDAAALEGALAILAGRGKGRLFRLLVERGLARSADSWSHPLPGGVLAGVAIELNPRLPISMDRIRRFVDGTLKQLRIVGPSRRELSIARDRLYRDELAAWEDPWTRACRLAVYELSRGGAERWVEEIRDLSALTEETVRNFARTHFVDAYRTTVEVFPPRFPSDDPRLARARLHTVEKGDTPASLAARYHVPLNVLLRENDLDPKYALVEGQPIWIPRR